MGAAAEFDRVGLVLARTPNAGPHGDHANLIPVFFAEERHRPRFNRLVHRHQACRDRRILDDDLVGHGFHLSQFVSTDRLGVRDVEAQAIGRNERALLRHMRAKHFSQRLMQEVGRRVVGADFGPARMIDFQQHGHSALDPALDHFAGMHEEPLAALLRIGDPDLETVTRHHAAVADLTT